MMVDQAMVMMVDQAMVMMVDQAMVMMVDQAMVMMVDQAMVMMVDQVMMVDHLPYPVNQRWHWLITTSSQLHGVQTEMQTAVMTFHSEDIKTSSRLNNTTQ